jgi:hypothetical protein
MEYINKYIYIHIKRDLSLMVKYRTFNLCHVGSNPIDLKNYLYVKDNIYL